MNSNNKKDIDVNTNMDLLSAIKNDLTSTEIRKLLRDFIIILISSIIVVFIFNPYLSVEKDTLFWLGSSIAMAFGALLAIILVLSSTQYQITSENIRKEIKALNAAISGFDFTKIENSPIQRAAVKKYWECLSKNRLEKENIFYKLHRTIQSLGLLISFALISITINGVIESLNFSIKNSLRLFFSIFLLIYSLYCMQILINRIYDTVELQKETEN